MKFTPKQLDGNVNVSTTHPLAEFAWLAGGLLLIVVAAVLLLGWGSDYAAQHLPPRFESWLGEHLALPFSGEPSPALQSRLERLVQSLPPESPLREAGFTIELAETPEVNAVALPGGKIVVFRGLLDKLGSENELAMVLAHELGHFAHRDHLRSLGRGLGLTFLSLVLFGPDSSISDAAGQLLLDSQSHYSREQEAAADRFGLELLVARYGHAGGATDFFHRFDAEAGSRIPYLLASHPHPGDRIRALDEMVQEHGYARQELSPLGEDLLPPEPPATPPG